MPTVVVGDFEWDENKAAANERKHGVTFVEAMTAFLDEHGIAAPDTERPVGLFSWGCRARFAYSS